MLPSRIQNHDGMKGVASSIATSAATPSPGRSLPSFDDEDYEDGAEAEQARTRLGEEDRRHHQHRDDAAATTRGSVRPLRDGDHHGERQERDHVHGQIVGISHQSGDRSVEPLALDEVRPGGKVEHTARRDVAHGRRESATRARAVPVTLLTLLTIRRKTSTTLK